eukprot:10374462-Lingulodinium_polyedra.AAC.1
MEAGTRGSSAGARAPAPCGASCCAAACYCTALPTLARNWQYNFSMAAAGIVALPWSSIVATSRNCVI